MGYNYEQNHRYPQGRDPRALTRDFHGAAIIAEDGTETPITESMVAAALASMHADWERHNRTRRRAQR